MLAAFQRYSLRHSSTLGATLLSVPLTNLRKSYFNTRHHAPRYHGRSLEATSPGPGK